MTAGLRLVFLVIVLIPQAIIFGMAYETSMAANRYFNQSQALALACSIFLVMGLPGLTTEWLVSKPLRRMRELCSRVKQGNYRQLLNLPNESSDGVEEDEIILLMRDMNWMARQIGIRESELQHAVTNLSEYQKQLDEKNAYLTAVNDKLVEVQKQMQKQAAELEATCKCMQVMAMTDPLTHIANRRCFFETLSRQITTANCNKQSVSLLVLDIDKFKAVNDNYGHQAGDKVLQKVAAIIQQNIRSSDLAARIGGEEYAILLTNATPEGASLLAQKVKMAIESHAIELNDKHQIYVTVSIGVCTLAQRPCYFNVEKLYCFADQALYYSKNNGRNCISVFYADTKSIIKVS